MAIRNIALTHLTYLFLIVLYAAEGQAAQCTIDSNEIDRGELKQFYVCGSDISPSYELQGLSQANIAIDYEQYVAKCSLEDSRPGVFLWLEGQNDARPATLKIVDGGSSQLLCDDLEIDVPDRVPLRGATLTQSKNIKSDIHLLKIEARKGQDLSQSCEDGLEFPDWGSLPSRWPTLSLLSADEMDEVPSDFRRQKQALSCETDSMTALVNVHGQQRDPAKVVVSDVLDEQGQANDAVTFVSLPEPAWASSMQEEDEKFVDVNGLRTRYFEKGKGDAMLLLHGGQPSGRAGGAHAWLRNIDGLAEHFRVFAIDRLGQGRTDNPKTEAGYENYYQGVIDHAYGFIEAMGLEKVHLVGHSQGGWPVTRLALDHPDLVTCVVNVDSVMAAGETNLHTARYYLYVTTGVHPETGETAQSIRRTRELQSHTLNNITLAGSLRGLALAQQPKILEADKQLQKLQMSPRHPSFQALRDKARQEVKDGKLMVPSLIIWGYNDPSSPFDGGLELFDLMNSGATQESRMYVFNDAGHSSYVEYPEEFNSVVTNFCGRY